jgi:hypothetical protein
LHIGILLQNTPPVLQLSVEKWVAGVNSLTAIGPVPSGFVAARSPVEPLLCSKRHANRLGRVEWPMRADRRRREFVAHDRTCHIFIGRS